MAFDWYEAETHCGVYLCGCAPYEDVRDKVLITLPWQCPELAEAIADYLNRSK